MRNSTFYLLFKTNLRTLKKSWSQFLAVIAIGAIAVTLFVGLLANAESFENQVNSAYTEGNLADLWVTTQKYDENDKAEIEKIIGTEGSLDERLYYTGKAGSRTVYSAVTSSLPTISKPYGEIQTNADSTSSYFCYIDKEFGNVFTGTSGSSILGQTLVLDYDVSSLVSSYETYLSYLDPYVISGGSNILKSESLALSLEITGTMQNPENVEKSTYSASVVLISDAMFKQAFNTLLTANYNDAGCSLIYSLLKSNVSWGTYSDSYFTRPNQYLITLTDEGKADTVKDEIQSYFSSKASNNLLLITTRDNMAFYQTVHADVMQARQFTFVFPFVFFAVAILVILTTLSQIVLKERMQIGTLKALGVKKRQIYHHYISLTLLLAGFGTLIGEILGPLIIPKILGQKYNIIYSLPPMQYTFPVLYGLLTAVIFLSVSALVTFLVCHKEVSLKPVESMRPVTPHFKTQAHLNLKKQKVTFLSIKMAFRNIRLSLVKSMMVIIGVMGCTALLCCGFGIEDTVYYGIDHDLNGFMDTDVNVTFSSGQDESGVNKLLNYDGVDSIEPYAYVSSTVYVDNGTRVSSIFYYMDRLDSHIKLDFGADEIAISEKTASKTGAKKGDDFNFQIGSQTYKAKVGLVFEAFVYNYVFIHKDASCFASAPSLKYQGAYVDIKDGYQPKDVAKDILDNGDSISTATTKEDFRARVNSVMSGVLVMTNAVKVFAILLAAVVLYNLALMNFKDRTRDIATLKVLGFSRVEIGLSLMFETMTLTAIGVCFGLLLGYPFMLAVLKTNIVELVTYLFKIQPLTYLYSFLLTFVVAFLVNAYFSNRTGKIQMVESLKSVE